jgi:hypothetical protein
MNKIAAAHARLDQAGDLPAVLDAAYDAFEDMLLVIRCHQDPAGGAFAAFVLSGASAANGRDEVASAPSLPRVSASPRTSAEGGVLAELSAEDAAVALAGLSRLLASRLRAAASSAPDADDQAACAEAARHAGQVLSLLGGAQGP